ncbi:DUF6257 family protein [Streptomyces ipomoeae]|uniref:DUF6257 family protein n=1 Tax=Streptomyces ipomoeae TaxID=103232 RepID=UPI0015F0DEAB|nr:DUF6257 family protein [Streptomyces ipomoeae]
MPEPKLTLAEKLQVIRLEARGIRRAAAGITEQPDVDRAVEAVYERARKREASNKK